VYLLVSFGSFAHCLPAVHVVVADAEDADALSEADGFVALICLSCSNDLIPYSGSPRTQPRTEMKTLSAKMMDMNWSVMSRMQCLSMIRYFRLWRQYHTSCVVRLVGIGAKVL
jgi:hypothetical protein